MRKKSIALILAMVGAINIAFYSSSFSVVYGAEKTIEDANAELDKVIENLRNLEKETEKLQSQIDSTKKNIANIESENAKLEKENEKIKKDIEAAEVSKKEKYELIRSVMKIQYEQNATGYLALLLQSKDLNNFIMRFEMVSNLIKNNNSLVDEINELESNLKEKKTKLENQIKEIEEKKKVAETEKVKLEGLKSKQTEEKKKLSKIQSDLEEEIKTLEKEAASMASGGKYEGGQMMWPVVGYYNISSYFGYRADPFTGETKYHNAIDIPAPAGTPVVAANGGTVITSSYSSSYGNLVIIDHGGGLLTYYAHNTSLLVSVGQKVSKGQNIATVGTTGNSTGNHSHFGVQLNGSFVDPMGYLQK
ncbi:murein hydrolase activator EnvC family protein [Clostridium ihumii]|uniref:murein hydrolase activator EnvC family protein n=1 Tax=Clostridium ihumii TaxID=1470356 RepID=UPI000688DBBF|nr:peptidoglycan DD-metalloendopeptidase family protein [Clostridium ihumii]